MKAILQHPGSLQRAGMGGAIVGLNLEAVIAAARAYGGGDVAVLAEYAGAAERGILDGQREVMKDDRT